jgi:hypothetical protein
MSPSEGIAFPGRRRGVDDLLHVPGLDVLAGHLCDHGGGIQRAQPRLGMRVLARPPFADREAIGVQVVGDEGGRAVASSARPLPAGP